MRVLIVISFLIAFVLAIYPLPMELRRYRPEFVAILVIYWCMYTPEYFGLLAATVTGLLLDVIEGTSLGCNTLGLIVIAYIVQLVYQRIRSYAEWQQAVWVFVFVGIYQLFGSWVNGFLGRSVESPVYPISLFLSALLWPFIVRAVLLLKLRLHLS